MPASFKTVAIIPARFDSQRFPGKPLALIRGRTLIQHTYENALQCPGLDFVAVATDDERIYTHVQSFGGAAIMTSPHCPTGTDRLIEALSRDSRLNQADIVLNIQGDEPLLPMAVPMALIQALQQDNSPDTVMATPITRISELHELQDPSVVKCVIDRQGHALYFSRSPIPGSKHPPSTPLSFPYYRHIGVYAFRKEFLLRYAELPPTPLQQKEDLEQLKILEHGYRIKTVTIDAPCIGVDTPPDVKKIEELLCKQNTSLLQAESAPL